MNIKLQSQEEVINKYGRDNQLGIATEELAELIQAISKIKRANNEKQYFTAKEHLIEEIADVIVCIDQIKTMFFITDAQITEMANFKIHRQMKRIQEDTQK